LQLVEEQAGLPSYPEKAPTSSGRAQMLNEEVLYTGKEIHTCTEDIKLILKNILLLRRACVLNSKKIQSPSGTPLHIFKIKKQYVNAVQAV